MAKKNLKSTDADSGELLECPGCGRTLLVAPDGTTACPVWDSPSHDEAMGALATVIIDGGIIADPFALYKKTPWHYAHEAYDARRFSEESAA